MSEINIQKTICNEILNDIQLCLHKCKNNKKTFNLIHYNKFINKSISLLECDNINDYNKSLNVINIKLIIKTPIIKLNNNYYIDYNTLNREIIIDKYG